MNTIADIIDWLNDWFGRILAPLIAVIALIVIYDVAMRFFFGRPSDWAFDVTKQVYGVHFMLLAAYGLFRRAHVEVDVLKQMLSRKGQAVLDLLGYALFFAPFIWVYLDYSWAYAARSWRQGETTYGMVALPVYPVKAVLVITGVLLLLQAIALVLRAINTLREEA